MCTKLEVNPLQGSILKGMLIFALPISLSALLTMLFSCADTVVIGRFGHDGAISAIGASASILNFLVSGLTALSSGITVVFGKYYGERKPEQVTKLLHSLPLTALVLGGGLSLIVIVFSAPILRLMNCPEEILTDALVYFRIYFLGVPLTLLSTMLSAALQAKGNAYVPFFLEIGAASINILLNLAFVIGLDWNVFGVAIATVLSQLLLAGATMLFLCRQEDELKLDLGKLTLFAGLKPVFQVGIPASLEGIILNLSGVIIASVINRFDCAVIAGNTVATSLEGLMVITFTGFANACTVFTSQNYGAKNMSRVRAVYRTTMLAVFSAAELAGIVLYLLSPQLVWLFTTDAAIAHYARIRMFYMCLFFGLCGTMNVVSGCEHGLGDAKTPLYISVICSVAFRLTWIFTYVAHAGTIEAIYMSYPLCWGLCTLLNHLAFCRLFRKKQMQPQA